MELESIYNNGSLWIQAKDVINLLYAIEKESTAEALLKWEEDRMKLITKE